MVEGGEVVTRSGGGRGGGDKEWWREGRQKEGIERKERKTKRRQGKWEEEKRVRGESVFLDT